MLDSDGVTSCYADAASRRARESRIRDLLGVAAQYICLAHALQVCAVACVFFPVVIFCLVLSRCNKLSSILACLPVPYVCILNTVKIYQPGHSKELLRSALHVCMLLRLCFLQQCSLVA